SRRGGERGAAGRRVDPRPSVDLLAAGGFMTQEEPAVEERVVIAAIGQCRRLITAKQRLEPGDVLAARLTRLERDVTGSTGTDGEHRAPRAAGIARTDVREALPDDGRRNAPEIRHPGQIPQQRSVNAI